MGAMKGIENGLKANVNDMFSHAKAIVHDNIYALNHKHYSGVMWVACLDWKTCHVCSQLDGKIFGYHMELFPSSDGKGGIHEGPPKIPKHFNCRCITVPILKGMEDDYTKPPNYREWFERQPKKIQLDILGPSRYALFKKGLPVERFVKDLRVLTLRELGAKRITRNDLLNDRDTIQGFIERHNRDYSRPITDEEIRRFREYLISNSANMKGVTDANLHAWADEIVVRMRKLPPQVQQLMIEFHGGITIKNTDLKRTAFFDNFTGRIHINERFINGRAQSMNKFFHEMGHAIDSFMREELGVRPSIGLNFRANYKAFIARAEKAGNLNEAFMARTLSGHQRSGISDMFRGLSNGKWTGDSGHRLKYYTPEKIRREGFAHIIRYLQDDTDFMRPFFPMAHGQFMSWLNSLNALK